MLAERFAETGILRLEDGRLILELAPGGRLLVEAWPEAERHVGQAVRVIARVNELSVLVAESIAPL